MSEISVALWKIDWISLKIPVVHPLYWISSRRAHFFKKFAQFQAVITQFISPSMFWGQVIRYRWTNFDNKNIQVQRNIDFICNFPFSYRVRKYCIDNYTNYTQSINLPIIGITVTVRMRWRECHNRLSVYTSQIKQQHHILFVSFPQSPFSHWLLLTVQVFIKSSVTRLFNIYFLLLWFQLL